MVENIGAERRLRVSKKRKGSKYHIKWERPYQLLLAPKPQLENERSRVHATEVPATKKHKPLAIPLPYFGPRPILHSAVINAAPHHDPLVLYPSPLACLCLLESRVGDDDVL
jgi:hypothetical protein